MNFCTVALARAAAGLTHASCTTGCISLAAAAGPDLSAAGDEIELAGSAISAYGSEMRALGSLPAHSLAGTRLDEAGAALREAGGLVREVGERLEAGRLYEELASCPPPHRRVRGPLQCLRSAGL